MTDRPLSVVPLPPPPNRNRDYIISLAEDFLARARDGKIRQVVLIWEDDETAKTSRCSDSAWSAIGMLEVAKASIASEKL